MKNMAAVTTRIRPWMLLIAALLVVGIVAAASRTNADDTRLKKMEEKVSDIAERVDDEIGALQTKDEASAGEVAGLRTALDEIKLSLDSLTKDLSSAKSADSSLQKKVDDLASKLSALDLRIGVLESRYNDHLRNLHRQG
jgi:septal ring factor EnvC (AmiA/AmiB activator)